ncbi:MAG TPA: putative Ig domain-containing protein [Thermoanaerobaculia bacterium]|nr:putative Ig domain-containing protein [Thermoanaerobaculia bacterium]
MNKKISFLLGAGVLAAAMTGWGATANVNVSNDTFTDTTSGSPTTTIHEGDVVHWHWSNSNHSTTSGTCSGGGGAYGSPSCTPNGQWDSGIQSSGFDFSHTFSTAGSFAYFCLNHGTMGMTGTIVVQSTVPSCGTITLSPSSVPAGVQGSAYETPLGASGGASPYTFTLASGSLPPGIQLDDSGELHGTPTATGAFSFTVTATDASHCTGTQAYSISVSPDSPAGESIVIPAVGSLAGALGSHFKTQVQLTNPGTSTIAGEIVYHAGNASAGSGDPTIPYTLGSWQTVNFDDVLTAMGLTGLGSADVVPTSGPAPVATVRIFNDDGANGTAGFTEPVFRARDFLSAGDTAVIVLPADPTNFRFNLGVRTLGEGASVTFTIWDESGALLNTVSQQYLPSFFAQTKATGFLGVSSLPPNGSIGITVTHGNAIFFGSTVDNRGSQDTSTQFTRHD